MNKMPVSILQEVMAKNGMMPNYELIHDGGGTHINTFTYQVKCDSLVSVGTGRSKKDAKHEAAKAMLKLIATCRNYSQLPTLSEESSVKKCLLDSIPVASKTLANDNFINAVGALKNLCANYSLQEPEYILVSDNGPSHFKIFTIRCVLSTFKEEGVATTKKQAKHEAAKKMIEKLTRLLNIMDVSKEDSFSSLESESEISVDIPKILSISSNLPTGKKTNIGMRISTYHTALKDALTTEARNKLLENLNHILTKIVDQPITNELVAEALSELEKELLNISLTVTMIDMDMNDQNHFVKAIRIDFSPALVHIGVAEIEMQASYKAILQMINTLILLLS